MSKQGLPIIFWILALGVLVIPFAWKFAPLFRNTPANAFISMPHAADLQQRPHLEPASTRPPPKLAANETPLPAPSTPEPGSVDLGDDPIPPPSPSPPQEITQNEALQFITKYVALGSGKDAFARKPLISFPLNDGTKEIDEATWMGQRREFGARVADCTYRVIGRPIQIGNAPGVITMTVPIAFFQDRTDATHYEGIAFDMIGVIRAQPSSDLHVAYHQRISDRTTMYEGRGVSVSNWKQGKVKTSAPANIRLIDNDTAPVVKECRPGSKLSYIPEDDRWLVVQDEGGYIGFIQHSFVVD